MSQPTPYTPNADFSQQEANNASGRSTVNTAALDAEFAAIETTLDQTLSNIQLLQRDDGKLGDILVEVRCLAPDTLNLMGGFNLRGLWAPATAYAVNDISSSGEYTYVCKTAHTSGGSFNAAYWVQFGFTAGADAAQAAAAAQVSADNALVSENNAEAAAIAAAASATTANGSATLAGTYATSAQTSAGTATTAATSAANSAALAASYSYTAVATFKNKLINGDFRINQRGYVSGAAVGSGLYGLDRWKMAASGDTFTFSTVANKTTVTIPATKVLRQVVEGLNLQTGTYVLSWEGTAQGKIGAGSLAASGVTGSITGGVDTIIEFGPGTLANVQLELGTVATPFEHRPISIEEILCQRYLPFFSLPNGTSDSVGVGAFYTATDFRMVIPFQVRPRVEPTGIINSAANALTVIANGAAFTSTNIVFSMSSLSSAEVTLTVSSGTAGHAGVVRATAAASFYFTGCEL